MTGRWLTLGVVLAAVMSGSWGCSEGSALDSGSATKANQPILNGTEAAGSKYDAVGALIYDVKVGVQDLACSGTLIAPKAVVTAKQCVTKYVAPALASGTLKTYFAFGPDATAPDQQIEITGYVSAPPSKSHDGLLLNGGRDVAVVHLKSAPIGITPAKLGLFTEDFLGTQFDIAGFGVMDSSSRDFYGYRFVGTATARALAGQWYNLLFNGDKQAFLNWYLTDAPVKYPNDKQAQDWWKTYRLEPQYELLAGGLPGEALACHGDSGGPIFLGDNAANLTVYGVSFAVEDSRSSICALGGAYLIFNDEMLSFVQTAIAQQ